MSAPVLPKLPVFTLTKIKLLQEKLANNVLQHYEQKRLTGSDFKDFVHVVHTALPRVRYSVLLNSIQHLAGQLITPVVNKEVSWRLAGNLHYLLKGIVIPPYSRQLFPEWIPVQVWDIERKLGWKYLGDKKNSIKVEKQDIEMDLFVLAGTPAGCTLKFTRDTNDFRCREVKSMLGFTHYDKRLWNRYFAGDNNYPMQDIRQLVKMRFFVYLDPQVSKAGEAAYGLEKTKTKKQYEPGYGLNCSTTMRKWNRTVMQRRERQNFQCPKGYELSVVPCHRCEVGFDYCLAGCHSKTYNKKFCPECKTVACFSNDTAEWCVDCVTKKT